MEYKSESYKRCHCQSDCYMLDINENANEPCWGEVNAIDEIDWGDGEYSWVHCCEGHWNMYQSNEPYIPEIKK